MGCFNSKYAPSQFVYHCYRVNWSFLMFLIPQITHHHSNSRQCLGSTQYFFFLLAQSFSLQLMFPVWDNLFFLPTQAHPLAFLHFFFLVFFIHFALSTFCLLSNMQLSRRVTSVFLCCVFSHCILKKRFCPDLQWLGMTALFEHLKNNTPPCSAFPYRHWGVSCLAKCLPLP